MKKQLVIVVGLIAGQLFAEVSDVTCKKDFVLDNDFLSREVSWKNGKILTKKINNKITSKNLQFSPNSNEFSFKLKDGEVLTNEDFSVEKVLFDDCTPKKLTVKLKSKKNSNFGITITYRLSSKNFFGKKQIKFDLAKDSKLDVTKLVVEDLQILQQSQPVKGKVFANGLGQPVYLNDTFWGVEWPVAENKFKNNHLKLSHKPGWSLKNNYKSKTAVFGVAEAGQVANVFIEKYVPTIRINPVKMAVLYNSWYDVRSVNKEDLVTYKKAIDLFKANLTDKYGIKVDYFVPDDGWQVRKSLYESADPIAHKKLSNYVNEAFGEGFGIWMPVSGNRGFDANWGKNVAKYEVIKEKLAGNNAYCLSGKKYGPALRKVIKHVMTDLDVDYFKLDNNWLYCHKDNHGHHPNSDSTVEEIFSLFDYMRSLDRKVYLNLTTRINLSPWWLMTADCLWMGGGDVGKAGEIPIREGAISYRDGIFQNNRQFQFPLNSIMTHGVIKGRYIYGFKDETERHFFNYIMMFIGRGVSMYELYFSPEILNSKEWKFLGENLKWAKENQDILYNNTRFLLGDVRKGKPYAYSHSKDNKAIIFVRNPNDNNVVDNSKKIKLKDWKVFSTDSDNLDVAEISKLNFNTSDWNNYKAQKRSIPVKDDKKIQYYRTVVASPENLGEFEKVRFAIRGLDDNSEIYLNGKKIGTHAGYRGVLDADGNEITKSNWHYSIGSYYSYSLNQTFIDINKNDLKENNVFVIKHFNRGKFAGFYRDVELMPILRTKKCQVSLKISPTDIGFDKKYKVANITEYYPQKGNEISVDVNKDLTINLDSFDVKVYEIEFRK